MKIKVFDIKFLLLAILFAIIIVYMTVSSIDLIDNNSASFVSRLQGEELVVNLQNDMEILKSTAESIANDNRIINALNQGVQSVYIEEICASITSMTDNLGIVDSIMVTSIKDNFLIAEELILFDYNILEADWFYDELLETDVVITDVYNCPLNNKKANSAVQVILNPESDEPLGLVIVNMYLEELLINLREKYRIADVDIFIEYDTGGIYLVGDEIIYSDEIGVDFALSYMYRNYTVLDYYIEGISERLVFAVCLDSINEHENVAQNREYVVYRIGMLTIGISSIVLLMVVLIMNPVLQVVKSLLNIIKELGDEYSNTTVSLAKLVHMARFIENTLPKKIKYLLYYDETTGLANRKMLKTCYNDFVSRGTPFVVIFLDIKNFKKINDCYGEDIGNRVLITVAQRIISSLSGINFELIRYNGDEFILMIDQSYIQGSLEHFYFERIVRPFNMPLSHMDTKPINLEFNAVAIILPYHATCEEDMISKLYIMIKEKKTLNNCDILVFNNEIYKHHIYQEKIKDCLRYAIAADEFVINYQPIINEQKEIVKAEALIRWFSADLGFVSPAEFIYVAEQTRMIIDLGNWIVERVARDLRALLDDGIGVQISINASPIQLMERDFVDNIINILDNYYIPYKYICIEITEGILLEGVAIVKNNIRKLQQLGIVVALDDFGTGYSSFNYLTEYNLDILKIDKIFIDNSNYEIIDVMSRIAKILNMQVVLEGIETQEQFDEVKQFGFIQGYYFSKPVRWPEFKQLLEQKFS
ncbi:MAG: hypothetical protein BEN18_06630 [Epulopiscium sp. Nuni2H_MBin001]|nr:MAG: hypothetical protein BEN18_06630 [Epulopiscium sp. Nuni2H_MBin001]